MLNSAIASALRRPTALALAAFLLVLLPVVPSTANGDVVRSRFHVSIDLVVDGVSGHGEGVFEVHMDDELSRSGSYVYYSRTVFGDAIEVPLEDGRVALVLKRPDGQPSNYGAGSFIIDCLIEGFSLDERPKALEKFDGGCTAHEPKPMVVIVSDGGLEGLVRVSYVEPADGEPKIDSITIRSTVTGDEVSYGIVDRYPWIADLPVAFEPDGSSRMLFTSGYYLEDFTLSIRDLDQNPMPPHRFIPSQQRSRPDLERYLLGHSPPGAFPSELFNLIGWRRVVKYADGQEIKVGDRVRMGGDDGGIVVCDIDARIFSPSYPESEWVYLNWGFVIVFPKYGVLHVTDAESDLELVART